MPSVVYIQVGKSVYERDNRRNGSFIAFKISVGLQ